jgi:hypothetical protein
MCKKYSQKFVWLKAAIATFFPYNFERRMSAIALKPPIEHRPCPPQNCYGVNGEDRILRSVKILQYVSSGAQKSR